MTAAPAVLLDLPAIDRGAPGVVLAAGAGSNRNHPVLAGVAAGLAAHGHPVVRFDFPYATVGARRPDPPAVLRRTWQAAVAAATVELGGRPLYLGGRSMGGRYASLIAAEGTTCAGLVLLGYPLQPPRRAASDAAAKATDVRPALRTAHWPDLRVPCLFVQGDRDPLCDLDLLAAERAALLTAAPSTVHVLHGADHAFAVLKRDGRTVPAVLAEVVGVVAGWLAARSAERVLLAGGQPAGAEAERT